LGVATGLFLVVLGVTFAMTAITENHLLGIAVGGLGVLVALWVGQREGTSDRRSHADITLGAVSIHRLVEGVVLGALYSSGIVVGLLAAIGIAGHTALETAAVSGLYDQYPIQAVGAAVLVQVGYVAGALVGIGFTVMLPTAVQVGASALAGGILIGIGTTETRHSAIGSRLASLA
jgi:zinc transporter ZupT